jgi:hypothetical protein
LVALVYEVEFTVPGSSLDSPDRERKFEKVWPEYIGHPCRSYRIKLADNRSADSIGFQECDVRLHPGDFALPEESQRCSKLAAAASDAFEISYPLQGAVYTAKWLDFDMTESALSPAEPAVSAARVAVANC